MKRSEFNQLIQSMRNLYKSRDFANIEAFCQENENGFIGTLEATCGSLFSTIYGDNISDLLVWYLYIMEGVYGDFEYENEYCVDGKNYDILTTDDLWNVIVNEKWTTSHVETDYLGFTHIMVGE